MKREKTIDKEPVYSSKGAQKGSDDIGNSYVEIDLTNQHLYLFQNGEHCIWRQILYPVI